MEPTHEHVYHENTNNNSGLIIAIVLLLVLAFLIFYYGLPMLRNAGTGSQINVPGKIDVNVNQPGQPAK